MSENQQTQTRVMRVTIHITPTESLTIALRECDVTKPLEEVQKTAPPVDSFVVYDIFTMEGEVTSEQVAIEAAKRQAIVGDLEHQKAISYHWNAARLAILNEGGVLLNPSNAPYGVDDCMDVAKQLSKHLDYAHQTIVMIANDNRAVSMHDGEVTVLPPLPA